MEIMEQYFRDSYTRKLKLITRILRGDHATAEDVVQEAFARALKFMKSYDKKRGTLDKWFNSIMFNAMHNIQNDHKGVVHVSTDSLSPQDVLEEEQLAHTPELVNYIEKFISLQENPLHKRILTLFFIMGYTSKEISQIEKGITQTNVTTIVGRFRSKLRDIK
jgi:RNA polymerase sigma factor (sigma-70 family)